MLGRCMFYLETNFISKLINNGSQLAHNFVLNTCMSVITYIIISDKNYQESSSPRPLQFGMGFWTMGPWKFWIVSCADCRVSCSSPWIFAGVLQLLCLRVQLATATKMLFCPCSRKNMLICMWKTLDNNNTYTCTKVYDSN